MPRVTINKFINEVDASMAALALAAYFIVIYFAAASHNRWLHIHKCSCAASSRQQLSVAATAQSSKYCPLPAEASSREHVAK
jgi:CDP-diacylglycerol pyrophosphatase